MFSDDNVTTKMQPAVAGISEAHAFVTILANGTPVGTGTVGSDASDGEAGDGQGEEGQGEESEGRSNIPEEKHKEPEIEATLNQQHRRVIVRY